MVTMDEVNLRLSTHSAIRLQVKKEGGEILALHLLTKERFSLNRVAAYIVVSFMGGSVVQVVRDNVARVFNIDSATVSESIEAFVHKGLLVGVKDSEHVFISELSKRWHRSGWIEALDFHLLTYDYPFLDYSERSSWNEDVARMETYRSQWQEPSRLKDAGVSGKEDVVCGSMEAALKALSFSANKSFLVPEVSGFLDFDKLSIILTASLGMLRERAVPNHPEIPSFIRKTSPSGGSRHPTEAFVLSLGIPGLKAGLYEHSVAGNVLKKVRAGLSNAEIMENLEGLFRSAFLPKIIIILTSVFERNRYRYREPRTFRTIFMDAGHVAATIELTANALGIRSFVQHGINDEWFEASANIDGAVEGALFGIALG